MIECPVCEREWAENHCRPKSEPKHISFQCPSCDSTWNVVTDPFGILLKIEITITKTGRGDVQAIWDEVEKLRTAVLAQAEACQTAQRALVAPHPQRSFDAKHRVEALLQLQAVAKQTREVAARAAKAAAMEEE